MMYSTGYNMDGDEYTFIDGSQTPQMHGDGTEDDHNQGWGGYAIQKPYWGGLVNGFQGGYRLYIAEPYVFDSSINIGYEHSKCGRAKNRGQKTDFIVWYYLDTPGDCNLKLTDEFDVGKPESEKAHQYRVTGEKWSGATASSYDRMEYSPREADDDRRRPGVRRNQRVHGEDRPGQRGREDSPPRQPQPQQRAADERLRRRPVDSPTRRGTSATWRLRPRRRFATPTTKSRPRIRKARIASRSSCSTSRARPTTAATSITIGSTATAARRFRPGPASKDAANRSRSRFSFPCEP